MRDTYNQRKMAECLLAEAEICDHIAAACADEPQAAKFKRRARECREAAAETAD